MNMALYKAGTDVKTGTGKAFEETHSPGTPTPYSGIYKCENCGREDACNKGNPLPPQNHNQHSGPKPIMWRCLVYAEG